jgi:hypothetical protein
MNINIKQCLYNVVDEHFTTTMKVLVSFGVASYNEDIMKVFGSFGIASYNEGITGFPLWWKLTLFSGVINCFIKRNREVKIVSAPSIY